MSVAVVLAAFVTLVAAAPGSWLDAKAPANWNASGAALPVRPGARDAELAPGGRCASGVRPATAPEDRALTARGWSLVGPYTRYGTTSVVMAMASADGMCRPNGYQAFVFVNGSFAGTLSPKLMDARTDGSISSLSVSVYDAADVSAGFMRYNAQDALCCPHGATTVMYHVQTAGRPRVTPLSTETRANPA
jgi:LppP/LprE lipoprotein